MKKNWTLITGITSILIVLGSFILPTWLYGAYSYFFNGIDFEYKTSCSLFNDFIYNNNIICFALLIIADIILAISAFCILKKVQINIFKNLQGIASVVMVLSHIIAILNNFPTVHDHSAYSLENLGYLYLGVCIANAIISFVMKEEKKIEKTYTIETQTDIYI